jgi:hypothetical protein
MSSAEGEMIARMRRLIYGNWQTCVTFAFAELGLADLLREGSRTAAALAAATGTNVAALRRYLRCCQELEFVQLERGTDRVSLTPFGQLLRSDHALSQRAAARLNGASYRYEPWGKLVAVLTEGTSSNHSPTREHGSLAYLADRPEELAVFQQAMSDLSVTENAVLAKSYDFGRFGHIIDVGGGHGSFLKAILKEHPNTRGTLFDLEDVLRGVNWPTQDPEVGNRLKLCPGDFFESLPADGDIYLLKNVVHNWPEEKLVRLLESLRAAMGTSTSDDPKRALIIEFLIPDEDERGIAHWIDLNSFVLVGGADRTAAEYEALAQRCGFKISGLIPTATNRVIIELAAV